MRVDAQFTRLGVVLRPSVAMNDRAGVLNPACTRLRDGNLQLYPRMVAPGNISHIGSFRAHEGLNGQVGFEQTGIALEPQASYELRKEPGGYGCEDPRVTYVAALDRYVMAYVAFGPRGPEVAFAVSHDGLAWERLGLVSFQGSNEPFADKDAAFFPEPVSSPTGVLSLAFYHRPTLSRSVRSGQLAVTALKALPRERREAIAIGYIPLDAVRADIQNLCTVAETHRLVLPPADWGLIKVGAGTPPIRVREGWMAVCHGVDELKDPNGSTRMRYCAGIIIHDAQRLDQIVYRSQAPLFLPELPEEVEGAVGHVVFPSAIDPRGDRVCDIFYGMADYQIGRGRLVLQA